MIEMHPDWVSGWRSVDEAAVREHLSSCSLCQSAAEEIHEWDSRLQTVMTDVPVPEGVRERLMSPFVNSAPLATPVLTTKSPLRRSRAWGLTGMSLSLALAIGMFFWWNTPAPMQTAWIGTVAIQALSGRQAVPLVAFDGSFAAEIADARWRRVCDPQPVGLDLDGRAGHDAAAYRVNIPSLRFRGWLVVVPVSRISDIPESLAPVTIAYSQAAAWRDDGEKYVFICVTDQSNIEILVDQWNGQAA